MFADSLKTQIWMKLNRESSALDGSNYLSSIHLLDNTMTKLVLEVEEEWKLSHITLEEQKPTPLNTKIGLPKPSKKDSLILPPCTLATLESTEMEELALTHF